jgi:hypothetical protein
MKTQAERLLEKLAEVEKYVGAYFSVAEREADKRLSTLWGLVNQYKLLWPDYSTSGLVIEYDRATGKPVVNKEMAQRLIRNAVEKAVADAEPGIELDVIDSARDETLIARMNGTYEITDASPLGMVNKGEAEFMLRGRLEMYRYATEQIQKALVAAGKAP